VVPEQPHRQERGVHRSRPAGAVAEQQRVDGLGVEDLFAVPAVALQQAVQR
jgi:hypothetical protein